MKCRFLHAVALLLAVMAGVARAQVGNGWIEKSYHEMLDPEIGGIHHFLRDIPQQYAAPDSACCYTRLSGIEEFHLSSTNSNRIEIRVKNDYEMPSPNQQFEGDVMLMRPTGNESVMQIFGNYSRATLFMLRGDDANGGSLRHYTHEVLATNVYETWVHVNVIHVTGQFVQVYLNGEFKGQWEDNSLDHSHFFKYGCYGTLDTDSAFVKWKSVKYFVGGTPPGRAATSEVGSSKPAGGSSSPGEL